MNKNLNLYKQSILLLKKSVNIFSHEKENKKDTGVLTHAYKPSTLEAETGESKFKSSLVHVQRQCLKTQGKQKRLIGK